MSLKYDLLSILDSLWALHKYSELDAVRGETLKVIDDLRDLMFALKFAVPKKHVSVCQMWDALLRAQLPSNAKIDIPKPNYNGTSMHDDCIGEVVDGDNQALKMVPGCIVVHGRMDNDYRILKFAAPLGYFPRITHGDLTIIDKIQGCDCEDTAKASIEKHKAKRIADAMERMREETKAKLPDIDSYALVHNRMSSEYRVVHYYGLKDAPPDLGPADHVIGYPFQGPYAKKEAEEEFAKHVKKSPTTE